MRRTRFRSNFQSELRLAAAYLAEWRRGFDERALGGGLPSRHAGTGAQGGRRGLAKRAICAQGGTGRVQQGRGARDGGARRHAAARRRRLAAPDPIHSIFTNAGFDPDASPICKQVSMLCPKLFVRTATHANHCKNTNHTCMCAMIKLADVKIVAKACIAHVLAIGEASAAKGEPFTDSVCWS